MVRKYINDAIYLVNDGTTVYPIYGCDAESEIAENDAEIVAGPFVDSPQNRHKIDSKCEQLNNEINGINPVYEAKKHRTIYLNRDQIKRLNEMDIQLTSDGTVSDAQNIVNKSQAQFNQARSIDGKNPNATITTPQTDNTKPTAYIQSNPGESAAQAISDNSETVQKVFDNNGSVSVEVNEGAKYSKKELKHIHENKGNCFTKQSILEDIKKKKAIKEGYNPSTYASVHANESIHILDNRFLKQLVTKFNADPQDVEQYIVGNEYTPEYIEFTINGTQQTDKGDYYTPDYTSIAFKNIEFSDETLEFLQEIPTELGDAIVAYVNKYVNDNISEFDWSDPEEYNPYDELNEAQYSKLLKDITSVILKESK